MSIKMATLDYVLKSDVERSRLGISSIPRDKQRADWGWGSGKIVARVPQAWADRVDESRDSLEQGLYITAPQMTSLLALWIQHGHQSCRLIDLPGSDTAAQSSGLANSVY